MHVKSIACVFAWLTLVCAALPVNAQMDLGADLRAKFETRLKQINASFNGVMGMEFIDLTDGQRIGLNADAVLPTASTIKVAILVELFRQAEHRPDLLTQQHPFKPTPKTASSGMARLIGPGSSLALEDIARLMINLSENTATNIIIDTIGMDNVNRLTDSLGLKSIRLRRKMLESEIEASGQENVASPADAATLMMRIARCELPVSKASCQRIRTILEIPQAPHATKDFIPKEIRVAFKPGSLEGVSTAWAIVDLPDRPYAFAVMTTYGTDGINSAGAASEAAYEYFSRLARANAFGARVSLESMRKVRAADGRAQ